MYSEVWGISPADYITTKTTLELVRFMSGAAAVWCLTWRCPLNWLNFHLQDLWVMNEEMMKKWKNQNKTCKSWKMHAFNHGIIKSNGILHLNLIQVVQGVHLNKYTTMYTQHRSLFATLFLKSSFMTSSKYLIHLNFTQSCSKRSYKTPYLLC